MIEIVNFDSNLKKFSKHNLHYQGCHILAKIKSHMFSSIVIFTSFIFPTPPPPKRHILDDDIL